MSTGTDPEAETIRSRLELHRNGKAADFQMAFLVPTADDFTTVSELEVEADLPRHRARRDVVSPAKC